MYVYCADTYCDSCGERIREDIDNDEGAPADPDLCDSDDYPQYAPDDQEVDGPDHCGAQGDCLEGIDLRTYGLAADAVMVGAETPIIGALLSDNLTEHGYSYLAELLDDDDPTPYQRALYTFWRETFDIDSVFEDEEDAAA